MSGFSRDRDGGRTRIQFPVNAFGISHSDGRYSRGCITSRRTHLMPRFEMTQAEMAKYGDTLSIWQKIALLNAWAPLLTFGQRYLAAFDPFAKAVVISECAEWLASKTDSGVDDELVKHLAAVLKTKEGEALVRWVVSKIEGMKS